MKQLAESLNDQEVIVRDYAVDIVPIMFNSEVHLPFGTIEHRPSAWLQLRADIAGVEAVGRAEGTSLPMQIPLYDDYEGNLENNIRRITDPLKERALSFGEVRSHIEEVALGGNFATARMTVEAAVIDTIARSHDISVYELMSGGMTEHDLSIPYGKSIAEQEETAIVSAALTAREKGAQRLKLKVSPSTAENVIRGISQIKGRVAGVDVMVDANGSFDPEQSGHLSILERLDELGLMMIEEPVSRAGNVRGLDAHRRLQHGIQLRTPIALDDAIIDEKDARIALEEGLGDIVNLKPGRVGSFLKCVEIADMAQALGKQIMVGGMYEATPGRSMTLTLAAMCIDRGFDIPGDVSLPQERLLSDLVDDRLSLDGNGNVTFNARKKGWGYTL